MERNDMIELLMGKANVSSEEAEEVLEICEQFPENTKILKQKKLVLELIESNKKKEMIVQKEDSEEISVIFTKIYCNSIEPLEIENSSVNEWSKVLLKVAYYEKNNKLKGIDYIRQCKKDFIDEKQLKILNILLDNLHNKRRININYDIYIKYLNCYIIDELVTQLGESKKEIIILEKEKNEVIQEIKEEPKKEKLTKKMVVIEGKRINSRNVNKEQVKQVPNKIVNNTLIKDVFKDEVLEIGKHLYVKMQNQNVEIRINAIKAWDRFENLVNKPITDKESLNKMISFLKRIENSTSAQINLDEKRYRKYL